MGLCQLEEVFFVPGQVLFFQVHEGDIVQGQPGGGVHPEKQDVLRHLVADVGIGGRGDDGGGGVFKKTGQGELGIVDGDAEIRL